MIKEIKVKTALHYHNSRIPTNWDLNIYRGCEHQCKYCFAQYSHQYLENNTDNFYDNIYVKTNIFEILDKELSKKTWKNTNLINISSITDCYQPIEKKYELMRKVLEVLIKHKQPVFILTKSSLIYRDYDLIKELSEKTFVNIGFSITTLDENIRKKIEPNVDNALNRLNILKEFSKLKCKTTIMFMPIIPYLTDTLTNIENIFKKGKEINVDYIMYEPVILKGICKINFYNFLKNTYYNTYKKIKKIYSNNAYANEIYEKKLDYIFNEMYSKYKIGNYNTYINDFELFKKLNKNELF